MKTLLIISFAVVLFASCGPSGTATNESGSTISSSPTGDTAITDHGTGAAKGAEAGTDTTTNQ